jgi:hypothetical protein
MVLRFVVLLAHAPATMPVVQQLVSHNTCTRGRLNATQPVFPWLCYCILSFVHINGYRAPLCCSERGGEHSAPFACTVLTRDSGEAFGSSATTGGLLLRCRYDLPPESHFFRFSGYNIVPLVGGALMSLPGEKFSMQSEKKTK